MMEPAVSVTDLPSEIEPVDEAESTWLSVPDSPEVIGERLDRIRREAIKDADAFMDILIKRQMLRRIPPGSAPLSSER